MGGMPRLVWLLDDTGLPQVFAPIEELFPVDDRALEIACGRGETAVWLAKRGMDVHGVDVSPVAIDLAGELALRSGVADRCKFEVWDLDDWAATGAADDPGGLSHVSRATTRPGDDRTTARQGSARGRQPE